MARTWPHAGFKRAIERGDDARVGSGAVWARCGSGKMDRERGARRVGVREGAAAEVMVRAMQCIGWRHDTSSDVRQGREQRGRLALASGPKRKGARGGSKGTTSATHRTRQRCSAHIGA